MIELKCNYCGRFDFRNKKSLSNHRRWHNPSTRPNLNYSGGKNPNWRGGKTINNNGYLIQHINGYPRLRHRIIMELSLGRKLNKDEVIHHINKNKTDNRIENLMLLTNQSEHCKIENFQIINKGRKQTKEHIENRVKIIKQLGIFKGINNPNYKHGNYIKSNEVQLKL